MMWLLCVNLLSICSVRVAECAATTCLRGGGTSDEDGAADSTLEQILAGYVYYCIMRMLFFLGVSFYTIGWESFADFPTLQYILDPPHSGGTSSANANEESPPSRDYSPISRQNSHEYSPGSLQRRGSAPELSSKAQAAVVSPGREGPRSSLAQQSTSDMQRQPEAAASLCRDESRSSSFGSASPSGGRSSRSASMRRKRRVWAQRATLVTPLVFLMVCSGLISAVPFFCRLAENKDVSKSLQTEAESGAKDDHDGKGRSVHDERQITASSPPSLCQASAFMMSISNPTGRLNRGLRYTLFVGFLQWVQQFFFIFPKWHRALFHDAGRFGQAWSLLLLVLFPVSMLRFIAWTLFPAGLGHVHVFLGVSHHVADQILVLLFKLWMLVAAVLALSHPEKSGFDATNRFRGKTWTEMASLFKYTFIMAIICHFARGCSKSQIGFVNAQNDLLVLVLAYPLLLSSIWIFTWAALVAPRKLFLCAGLLLTFVLGLLVCWKARMFRSASVLLVWLHLMRHLLNRFGKRKTFAVAAAGDVDVGGARRGGGLGLANRDTPERKWCRVLLLFSALICLAFSFVLVGLSLMSGIQEYHDWYPKTISFRRMEEEILIYHCVLVMNDVW